MNSDCENLEELFLWMDRIPLSRPKKNISRDFSDGVMVAELLKFFYPKLVELHNYTPASCLAHKMNNWITLNRKVLSKIGLRLCKEQMENLAAAVPDAVVKFLFDLRRKIQMAHEQAEEQKLCAATSNHGFVCLVQSPERDGESMTCDINNSQQFVLAVEQMVPQRMLDGKVEEIAEKDDAIRILTQKVSHLDILIKLKDQRIRDLTQQLQLFKCSNGN